LNIFFKKIEKQKYHANIDKIRYDYNMNKCKVMIENAFGSSKKLMADFEAFQLQS